MEAFKKRIYLFSESSNALALVLQGVVCGGDGDWRQSGDLYARLICPFHKKILLLVLILSVCPVEERITKRGFLEFHKETGKSHKTKFQAATYIIYLLKLHQCLIQILQVQPISPVPVKPYIEYWWQRTANIEHRRYLFI